MVALSVTVRGCKISIASVTEGVASSSVFSSLSVLINSRPSLVFATEFSIAFGTFSAFEESEKKDMKNVSERNDEKEG